MLVEGTLQVKMFSLVSDAYGDLKMMQFLAYHKTNCSNRTHVELCLDARKHYQARGHNLV